MTAEEARKLALRTLGDVVKGEDPAGAEAPKGERRRRRTPTCDDRGFLYAVPRHELGDGVAALCEAEG